MQVFSSSPVAANAHVASDGEHDHRLPVVDRPSSRNSALTGLPDYSNQNTDTASPDKRLYPDAPSRTLAKVVMNFNDNPCTPRKRLRAGLESIRTPVPHQSITTATASEQPTTPDGISDRPGLCPPSKKEQFLQKLGTTGSGINLATCCLFLENANIGSWALTGSVAMKAYGIECEHETRLPMDVDILVSPHGRLILERRFQYEGRDSPASISIKWKNGTLLYDNKKIDVLVDPCGAGKHSRLDAGSLGKTVRLNGIPVVDIDSLLASKSRVDPDTPEEDAKKTNDIVVLNQLKKKYAAGLTENECSGPHRDR